MATSAGGTIITLFLSAFILSACGNGPGNANISQVSNSSANSNTNSAKSNVEELSLLVRVPYEAEDIVWKQDPGTRHIVAVFRFSAEDADRLVAEASAVGPGRGLAIPVETWYPEELIAQGEMSGDSTLKGTAYPANAFFQEPYETGRITRVEGTDYFVLEVSTK
jgi:hypothetical protein